MNLTNDTNDIEFDESSLIGEFGGYMLTPSETERYDRQIMIGEIGKKDKKNLRDHEWLLQVPGGSVPLSPST
jgi:hypothetical protein